MRSDAWGREHLRLKPEEPGAAHDLLVVAGVTVFGWSCNRRQHPAALAALIETLRV
jgi:hypothetical protein